MNNKYRIPYFTKVGLIIFMSIVLLFGSTQKALAALSEYVTMNVGETKTHTLPPSISNLTLKDVVFTSGDPINVKILYNTATTVTIEAVAATNSYIPIMCDFYYYTLRSGKWIYAHHEPFYFMVAVFGSGQNPDPTPNPDSWDGNGTCTITTAEGIPMKFIIINETNKYCAPWGNALNGGTCIDKSTAGKVTIPERIGNYRVYNTGSDNALLKTVKA